MTHGPATEPEDDGQTDDDERDDDVGELVVAMQDLTVGADEGDAPFGTGEGPVDHVTFFAVDLGVHVSLFTGHHLVADG